MGSLHGQYSGHDRLAEGILASLLTQLPYSLSAAKLALRIVPLNVKGCLHEPYWSGIVRYSCDWARGLPTQLSVLVKAQHDVQAEFCSAPVSAAGTACALQLISKVCRVQCEEAPHAAAVDIHATLCAPLYNFKRTVMHSIAKMLEKMGYKWGQLIRYTV